MQPWKMMPWYGMIFGPIMMIIWLIVLIVVAAAVIRWLQGGTAGRSRSWETGSGP